MNARSPMIIAMTDDGVEAVGYNELLRELSKTRYIISAHAPKKPWTSYGTALAVERFVVDEVAIGSKKKISFASKSIDVTVYDLSPAGVARVSCALAFQKRIEDPVCFVAGVNYGPNVGENLLHSGTFCAALIAFWNGLSSLAISLDDVYSVDENLPGPLRFNFASKIALLALKWMISQPEPILLNINVPNKSSSNGSAFEAARINSSNQRVDTLLRSDIEVLKDRRTSVTAFPSGSFQSSVALSKEASRILEEAFRCG